MPRLEGGLHGLKPDSSARADDQDCRHGVMLHGRTRLAHRHVRCSQAHLKTGRGFKRIGYRIRTAIGPQPRPPDGINTGRQIEYATVEEEYAAGMTLFKKRRLFAARAASFRSNV